MQFLDISNTMPAVHRLLKGKGPIRAAVAYWGDGAVESLGIAKDQDLIIVCDVLSGGCNPAEIRKLLRILGPKRVLTFDRLHAKVWLTDKAAVLGSSNASSNGLGFEGKEALSLVEANIAVDTPKTVAALRRWWDQIIQPGARAIKESDLIRAKLLRERQRKIRPLTQYRDLATAMRSEPMAYEDRGITIWVWKHEGINDWVDGALAEAQRQYGEDIECWQDVEDPPAPGSFVIDFDTASNTPRLDGMFRILSDQPVFRSTQGSLLLCKRVKRFEGMPVGKRRIWEVAAQASLASKGIDTWSAPDFARFIPAL